MDRTSLINELKSKFAEKRARAQGIAYSFLVQARQDKEYLSLEKKEREVVFEIAKYKANGIDSAALEREHNDIIIQKTNVLSRLGINPESLLPNYECKLCEDVGFRSGGMCTCFKQKLHEEMIKQSGLGKNELATFNDYHSEIATNADQQKELESLKNYFLKWTDAFPNNKTKMVLITGKTGVGKTFLSECVARNIIDKGYLVSFVTAFGMNNLLLKYHSTFNDTKSSYMDMLLDPDVLIIDDLGTEPILKNITIEYLYVILSERIRHNKATLITTNLSLEQIINRYGERIYSRIVNKQSSFITRIDGDDLRFKKR